MRFQQGVTERRLSCHGKPTRSQKIDIDELKIIGASPPSLNHLENLKQGQNVCGLS